MARAALVGAVEVEVEVAGCGREAGVGRGTNRPLRRLDPPRALDLTRDPLDRPCDLGLDRDRSSNCLAGLIESRFLVKLQG